MGYPCHDYSRRAHPLRNPSRARLGASEAAIWANFRGRGPVFRRRGARRARFRRQIRAAVGRRLAPPPRPEIRRRGGAEPAQTARGRGGAARRRRPRETGQDLGPAGRVYAAFRTLVRSRRPVPPRSGSPPSPPTCRRRSTPTGQGSSPRRSKDVAGRGRPAPLAAAAAAEAAMCAPRRRAARPFAPTPRSPEPSPGRSPCPCSPASSLRAGHRGGAAAAPGRGRLGQARRARVRPRGARRARPRPRPLAPRGPARGRRAKTARQGEDRRARGAARRRRRLRRGADRGPQRPRPPAAVRAPGRPWRGARATGRLAFRLYGL